MHFAGRILTEKSKYIWEKKWKKETHTKFFKKLFFFGYLFEFIDWRNIPQTQFIWFKMVYIS